MMLLYKAWRESRTRFVSAMVALTAWCVTAIFPLLDKPPDIILRLLHGQTYSQYIDFFVFDGLGKALFLLLVMFLALGGLLRERAHRTAFFTLALPVTRTQLAGGQIAVGIVELAALSFFPALVLPLLSGLTNQSYVVDDALRFAVLRVVCGTVVFGVTFFLSVILRGEYTAMVGSFLALLLDGALSNMRALHPYYTTILRSIAARWDWHALGPDMTGPPPWPMIAAWIAMSLAFFAAAALIMERQSL